MRPRFQAVRWRHAVFCQVMAASHDETVFFKVPVGSGLNWHITVIRKISPSLVGDKCSSCPVWLWLVTAALIEIHLLLLLQWNDSAEQFPSNFISLKQFLQHLDFGALSSTLIWLTLVFLWCWVLGTDTDIVKFIELPHEPVFWLCKQAVETVEGVSLEFAMWRLSSDWGNEVLWRLSLDVWVSKTQPFRS